MLTPSHSKTVEINFTNCYANGRLKYSELNNILQITASEHAEIIGVGFMDMAKHDQSWVLSRLRIEIDRLPKFRETITIKTWVQEFLGNRTTRNFAVFLNDIKIISVTSLWTVINLKLRKADHLVSDLDLDRVITNTSSTAEPATRIAPRKQYQISSTYQTKLSDVDMVKHVNNIKYTDWCLDLLPADLVLTHTFKTIDMNYLREVSLHQEVDLHGNIEGEKLQFAVNRNGKTAFLMDVTLS